ncbi:hypothetical protein ACQ86F_10455 [Streptomyces venezuelae ATCC 10712]
MRIWFHKHTVEGRLPLLDQWYREHLDAIAAPGTTVDIKTLPADTYPDRTPSGWSATTPPRCSSAATSPSPRSSRSGRATTPG